MAGKGKIRMVVEEFQVEGIIHKDTKVRDRMAHLGVTSCLDPN